jgi:sterol desaturase/sphingolipid hydroxylase (fatty acid hydroxylase superfamily)
LPRITQENPMLSVSLIAGVCSLVLERIRPAVQLPGVPGWNRRAVGFVVLELMVAGTVLFAWMMFVECAALFDLSEHALALQVLCNWLLSTFVFYWWHRVRHSNNTLWRLTHQLHHSPSRIETLTTFYKHPLEVAADTLLNLGLSFIILGVSVPAFVAHLTWVACMQLLVHVNTKTPHWLGYLVSRPEMHRIHHEAGAHKNNYSDFPLWDFLFGTYENPPSRAVECGFSPQQEARVRDMLLLRDVHRSD